MSVLGNGGPFRVVRQITKKVIACFVLQQARLWVSDPKALQYIVVKEQDVYEETDLFIQ